MRIEQIVELRGPGPPDRICTIITSCFHDKTIISKVNIRLDSYLLQEAMYFTSPYLGQIAHKM